MTDEREGGLPALAQRDGAGRYQAPVSDIGRLAMAAANRAERLALLYVGSEPALARVAIQNAADGWAIDFYGAGIAPDACERRQWRDFRSGVEDAPRAAFDVIVCEELPACWTLSATVIALERMLRPGGVLWLADTPTRPWMKIVPGGRKRR
ncbi:MAG: hypothetical protein KGJ78_11130 [Alphaproteobacteria bacterium]|nr:hypothetical protein [Alphaproteobacteria bacterium]